MNNSNLFYKQLITIIITLFFTISLLCQNNCTSQNQDMQFDGDNDAIITPSPLNGDSDYTISIDFKTILNQGNGTYPRLIHFVGFEAEISIRSTLEIAFYNGNTWFNTGLFVQADTWNNIIVIRNGSDIDLYFNSELILSATSSTLNFIGDLIIGGRGSNSEFFGGDIDNVKIWDYAVDQIRVCDIILGNTQPNALHYDFEEGNPNGNNTSLNGPLDLITNTSLGSFSNFDLIGTSSNYVCSYDNIDGPSCTLDDCIVNTIAISTGFDHGNTVVAPAGQQIGYWTLVDMPPPGAAQSPNLSLPYVPFTLSPNPAWGEFPGSAWVSAFESNTLDENNLAPLPPYSYETYFCVSEDNSDVLFDFQALADDVVTVLLTDTQGNPLHTFGTANFKIGDVLDVNESINLDAGTYCIRGDVRNTNSVAMGFNLEGTISGASFIDYGCCEGDGSVITGQKFHDKNCDGLYSSSELAMGLGGWEIQLSIEAGQVVDVQFTDDLGFYYFRDLPAGNYTIEEVNQPDWEQLLPGNNLYQVDLGTFEVQGGFHFGNKYTGPIVTDNVENTCVGQNSPIQINWSGQTCDCQVEVIAVECNNAGPDIVLGTVDNIGTFNITPGTLQGDYGFLIRDCDGNEIPVNGCVTFTDFTASINTNQLDCGEYEFSFSTSGFANSDINSIDWVFDVEGTSNNLTEIISFENAGTYTISLSLTLADGCIINQQIQLTVDQGANDPDCSFCVPEPPKVLAEIEDGDVYIEGSCYGVVLTSPNGTCFRVLIDEDGLLYTEEIDCL